jgi:hypothetical protein
MDKKVSKIAEALASYLDDNYWSYMDVPFYHEPCINKDRLAKYIQVFMDNIEVDIGING